MNNGNVEVYGLADDSEPVGKGFEPYEQAAISLQPDWIDLEDDAIPVDQLRDEAQNNNSYVVTAAENYEAFSNDDLMPLAVKYREHDTLAGSPGVVLTYNGSDVFGLDDLIDTTVAVEEVEKGTTMAFLTAAEARGYDPNGFDLVEVSEDEAPEMLANEELDAAILDSDDWLKGAYEETFNFNRVLANRYGEVPPAQIWVADSRSYNGDYETFDDFVQWGKNVKTQVEERTANRPNLTSEQQRKIDIHTRFDEFRPQDSQAIDDIIEVANKVA